MSEPLPVRWTTRSLRNAQNIRSYLITRFSEKEALNFEKLLEGFEQTVSWFPELYPASRKHPDLRKAVLHRYTSLFYSFRNNEIVVVAIQDNRQQKPEE